MRAAAVEDLEADLKVARRDAGILRETERLLKAERAALIRDRDYWKARALRGGAA